MANGGEVECIVYRIVSGIIDQGDYNKPTTTGLVRVLTYRDRMGDDERVGLERTVLRVERRLYLNQADSCRLHYGEIIAHKTGEVHFAGPFSRKHL